MKFETEEARLAHPQAGRIPLTLWESSKLFNSQISEEVLGVMSVDLTAVERLETTEDVNDNAQLQRCICLFIGHPEASLGDLLDAAKKITTSHDLIFIAASLTNRPNIMDGIEMHISEKKRVLKENNYLIYQYASRMEYWEVVKKFIHVLPQEKQAMMASDEYAAFRFAAGRGNIEFLRWLKTNAPELIQAMISSVKYAAFCEAAAGHIEVLSWLKTEASPAQWEAMLTATGYSEDGYAILEAAAAGSLDALNWLKAEAPEHLQAMIALGNFAAFWVAARYGRVEVLDWFKREAPAHLAEMTSASAFAAAAGEGELAVLKWFKEEASVDVSTMIAAWGDYECRQTIKHASQELMEWLVTEAPEAMQKLIPAYFVQTAKRGDVPGLDWFKSKFPAEVPSFVAAYNFAASSFAARKGRVNVLNWLKENASNQVQDMIEAGEYGDEDDKYTAFDYAAMNGHIPVLQWLKDESKEKWLDMLLSGHCSAIRNAAYNGQVEALNWFKVEAASQLPEMLASEAHGATIFHLPIRGGHFEALLWLANEAPGQLETALLRENFALFQLAMDYHLTCQPRDKHYRILSYLLEICPIEKRQELIERDNFSIFRFAVKEGYTELFEQLITKCAPERLQSMLAGHDADEARILAVGATMVNVLFPMLRSLAGNRGERPTDSRDYAVFCEAAKKGHLDMVQRFFELVPIEKRGLLLKTFYYKAFREAAEEGHLPVVNYLLAACTLEELHEMLEASGRGALDKALLRGKYDVVMRLLSFSTVFDLLERSERYWENAFGTIIHYDVYLSHFVTKELNRLSARLRDWQTDETVLNIQDPEEVKRYFIILRYMIRRNDPMNLLNAMRFLLKIPAVASLAAQTEGPDNPLVMLALRSGNQQALRLLLSCPAIRENIQSHVDFYSMIAEQAGHELFLKKMVQARLSLETYIERIQRATPLQPNFSHGFWVCKQSRAINREANYLLAQSLLQQLDAGEVPLDTIFSNINKKRHDLIVERRLNERADYVERGLHSSELNAAITCGL